MGIPSQSDWGETDENDLEAKSSLESFLGKSFSDAEAMFRRNALYYQEELQSLPAIPFNFYAPALASYITSESAKGDSDGASSFLHMLIWILRSNRQVIAASTERTLVQAANQVAQQQEFYAAPEDIYGKFTDFYAEIQRLAENGTQPLNPERARDEAARR
jgi:hypothetical protein